MGKKIEIVQRRVGDLKLDFGNPRKIKAQKKKDLAASLEEYGDFDIIVINEKDQVIGGNQRVTIFQAKDPDMIVDCKMLVGYTVAEQKYINIKLNSHAGEWVMDELAAWTADLIPFNLNDVDAKDTPVEDREIKDMELIRYEKYNYVMLVCRSELDYNDLVRKLGIEGAKVKISKRKIAARAIWYDKMDAVLVPTEEYEALVAAAAAGEGGA